MCLATNVGMAQTARDTYLNIANAETIETAGYSGAKMYDYTNKVLVVSALVAYNSPNQKWVSATAGGSSSDTWTATGVFKGADFYRINGAATAATNSSRTYSYKVTNCTQVSALVRAQGNQRQVEMTVYRLSNDGSSRLSPVNSTTTTYGSTDATTLTISGLNQSYIYEIAITSTTDSNSSLYEVAFYAGNLSGITLDNQDIVLCQVLPDGNKKATYKDNEAYEGDMLLVRLTPNVIGNTADMVYDDWANGGYEIYYTTNMDDPTKLGIKYEGSLRIINTLTLRVGVKKVSSGGWISSSNNSNGKWSKDFEFNFKHMSIIPSGTMKSGERETLPANSDNPYVIVTYGSPTDTYTDGQGTTYNSIWDDTHTETASQLFYSQIAGFERYAAGRKDATGEYKWRPGKNGEEGKYDDYQYKYDGETDYNSLNTFDIPNSGCYFMYEPEVDGEISVVVRQTGFVSQEVGKNVASDLQKVVKRYAFVCDETGKPLSKKDGLTATISSNALLEGRAFAWTYNPDDANYFLRNVTTTEKDKDGNEISTDEITVGQSRAKLMEAMVALYKANYNNSRAQYYRSYWQSQKSGQELDEQVAYNLWEEWRDTYVNIDASGYNKNTGEGTILTTEKKACDLNNVLMEGDYGYYVLGKAVVVYTFPVKAGKTYFMMGRWTKLAPQGFIFKRDYKDDAKKKIIMEDGSRIVRIDGITKYNETSNTAGTTGTLGSDIKLPAIPADYNDPNGLGTITEARIIIQRPFHKDVWTSLVLPFSLSPATVREKFGDDTEIVHFNRVGVTDNKLYLTKHYHQMIVAGTPVLIKPSNEITKDNYITVDVDYYPNTPIWKMDGQSSGGEGDKGGKGWHITGSYTPAMVPEFSYIMGYNPTEEPGFQNNLRRIVGGRLPVAGTRAWIVHEEDDDKETTGQSAHQIASFEINGVEDTATTIEDLLFGEEPATVKNLRATGVYNLNGQLVRSNTTDTTGLPAGIYIAGGRKVIVK